MSAGESMVERMARALAAQQWQEGQGEDSVFEYPGDSGEEYAEAHWPSWVDPVRAVLVAMREPTEAMWKAGNAERIADGDYLYAEDAWRAMIDAAVKGVTG